MKLRWFEISNFHSVLDSGRINEEELMVLVGKNQAGKSSILLGLEYLSFSSNTHASSELTTINSIKSNFEDDTIKSKDLPIVTANFLLEESELEKISENFEYPNAVNLESSHPFDKFITALMKQTEIRIAEEIVSETVIDGAEKESESETTSSEPEFTTMLDPIKFPKLIKENFKNITISKFVNGEYSLEINGQQYFFENPRTIELSFGKFGKKIWDELKADFDRAPNTPFKDEFENLINPLFYPDFYELFSIDPIAEINKFAQKALDGPLKQKLSTYQKPLQDLFDDLSISKLFHALISEIYNKMPKIFYFTTFQRLEDSLTLAEIKQNPLKHQTFVNFLKLAGVNIEFLEKHKTDIVRLRPYLTSRSGEVSKKIKDVYKQEKVDFVIEFQNDVVAIFTCYPPNLTNLLSPSSGSAGFQWYIGFYINFAVHTDSKYRNAVLLLDDPGVLLHPSGHKGFSRRIERLY